MTVLSFPLCIVKSKEILELLDLGMLVDCIISSLESLSIVKLELKVSQVLR